MAIGTTTSLIAAERDRRFKQREQLIAQFGQTLGVPAKAVNELRIYYGGRGIWFNKETTKSVADPGVAVGVLHNGTSYDDDLEDDLILYHYPRTDQPGTDRSEIEATKNAHRLEIPVFVVVKQGTLRDVHLAWVEDWDDNDETFLITFGEDPPPPPKTLQAQNDTPFNPFEPKKRKQRKSNSRSGQKKFAFDVRKRYGTICAACGLSIPGLIDAAHIIPDSENGTNDSRNGLPLCPTHHRAFDNGHFIIHPTTHQIFATNESPTLNNLGITQRDLSNLADTPHAEALTWRWNNSKNTPFPL